MPQTETETRLTWHGSDSRALSVTRCVMVALVSVSVTTEIVCDCGLHVVSNHCDFETCDGCCLSVTRCVMDALESSSNQMYCVMVVCHRPCVMVARQLSVIVAHCESY